MGKIILEFDSVEESIDARLALDASKWKMSVWDLDQSLRNTTKYGASVIDPDSSASELETQIAEKYRKLLREILEENGLNLND